jgi:hypothetical protein
MHRFFIYLWTIEWCLPVFVLRFRWTWRPNRLLAILSAFCFRWFILLSITFPSFCRVNCVLHVCFFYKTQINKLKIPTLLLKKFIRNQSFRSDSDFSLVCHRGFGFSMRLHRCLLIILLQNEHRLNSCAFRFSLSIIWLRLFVPPFLLWHTFVI